MMLQEKHGCICKSQKTRYLRTFNSFMPWWKEEPGSPLSPFVQIMEVNKFPKNSYITALNMGFGIRRRCDAPKPGCPLTTHQPTEYSWMSGNLLDIHENWAESPLYGELYTNTKPVPNSSQ